MNLDGEDLDIRLLYVELNFCEILWNFLIGVEFWICFFFRYKDDFLIL